MSILIIVSARLTALRYQYLDNSNLYLQKNRATLRSRNCTIGYLPQRYWYWCSEMLGHLYPNVHSSNVHNSQTVEGAMMSFNRWMDKEDVRYTHTHSHTHTRILFSHQKGRIPTICFDMDGTRGYYAEWNKSIGG